MSTKDAIAPVAEEIVPLTRANLATLVASCPGLSVGDDGLLRWADGAGNVHALATAPRVSIEQAARLLGLSESTVRRRITDGEIYPVVRYSARLVSIYVAAVNDYGTRAAIRGLRKEGA